MNDYVKEELNPVSADILGAKAGGGQQRQPTREDDTTATLAKLSILYGLSEGVVRGFGDDWSTDDMKKRVYLDGTPIMSEDGTVIHNVEIDYRSGTIDQTAIDGVPSVTVETPISVEVRHGNPVARTFLRTEVNSYVVRLSLSRLMRNTLEGDSYGDSVSFAIDVASASGSFSEYGQYTITEKISQGFQRDYPVVIPQSNNRTIRIRKLTADGDNSLTFNDIVLEAITEVVEVKLRYPHTALLWLKYNARDFSSAPKVEVLLDGKADIKIPMNYNANTRAYNDFGAGTTNGIWNGEFKLGYTDNPVWHWLDLATNKRYGLGNRITIDIPNKFYLYSLARYCDELVPDGKGGLEPRFTCNNMYLQKQEDAFTVFKDLASVFRAKTMWDGAYLTPKMDAPRDAMLVFSRANSNNVQYSSTSDAAQHNVIAVQFYDTENHYESKFAYARSVENIQRRGKIEQVEVTALGCTSEGQAQRAADYLLNTELTETEIVTFITGLDGMRPVVGDVFVFADDLLAGKSTSGRVVSVSGANVTLDRELNPDYDLGGTFIANTTEALASVREIVAISEDKFTVTLDTAIDVVDITGLVWAVKSSSVGLREFTIDDLKYDASEHKFTVSGILYNRSKYSSADGAAHITTPPISIIEPFIPSSPDNVSATYYVVVQQGINISNIDVAWTQVMKAAKYAVEMRRDGAEWKKLGETQSLMMTIDNVYAGAYEFRVRSFDVRGNASVFVQSQPLLVQGKTLPPPVLDQFTATGELLAIRASWSYPSGTEDSLAVMIESTNVNPAEGLTNVQSMSVAYPARTYTFTGLGVQTKLWLRAAIVDRHNITGAFTPWVNATANSNPNAIIDLISGHISQGMLDTTLNTKINGVVTEAGNATAAIIAQGTALRAETDVKVNALRVEINPQIAALQTGITNVTTNYQAADTAVVGQLNAYKAANDTAVASVLQKADSAVATGTANSSAITAINAQVVTINGTLANKFDASAINNYYTKAQADAASAGQVTAFSSSLVIGGTNLLLNSNFSKPASALNWNSNGGGYTQVTDPLYGNVVQTTMPNGITHAWLKLENGVEYTYSALIKHTAAITMLNNSPLHYHAGLGNVNQSKIQVLSKSHVTIDAGVWTRINIVFKLTGDADSFKPFIYGASLSGTLQLAWTKLERGNKATDWSTSPVEVNTAIDATAAANVATNTEVSRINGVVLAQGSSLTNLTTSIAGKADNSALSALESRVTSAEGVNTAQNTSITNLQSSVAGKADSSAFTALSSRVTTAEGVISSQSSQLTGLSTTVGNHTTSIAAQTTSIDGIKAVHAFKIDNNGVMSGYGLVSELINGTVYSQFGINADNFFIGAPAGGKKPFIVLTSAGVINGVSVPAGTYIDTGFIGTATIDSAKIRDAAITTAKIADAAIESAKIADAAIATAKIANAAITTAKIGDLQVDTLKIKDNAVTVPLFLEDANMISYRYASGTFVVGEVVLTGIKQGERVMVQMYAQSASGGIELRNAYSGGYAFAYIFLNDVQQAVIRTGADSSYYESNNAEGGGGGGTTVVIGNAFVAFGTNPTVYAFVSPTDNPKITVKVNSTKWFYIVKNVPLVFTTIGLKK